VTCIGAIFQLLLAIDPFNGVLWFGGEAFATRASVFFHIDLYLIPKTDMEGFVSLFFIYR